MRNADKEQDIRNLQSKVWCSMHNNNLIEYALTYCISNSILHAMSSFLLKCLAHAESSILIQVIYQLDFKKESQYMGQALS